MAGLRPINVEGRGDCLAINIVGIKESLPKTLGGNACILTMTECFTRYADAGELPDQTSSSINQAVLKHWISLYGTPRRIFNDQIDSDSFY